MAPRYSVRVKNTAGATVAVMVNWQRLEYTKRIDAPDNHTLMFDSRLGPVSEFVTDAQVRFFISSCMLTNHCCCIVEAGAPRDFLLEAWNETGYNRTCVLRKAAGQCICWPTEGCTAAETATGWERAFFFITCTQKRDRSLPHLLEEFKIHFRMYAV